jgi:hypothetical protein
MSESKGFTVNDRRGEEKEASARPAEPPLKESAPRARRPIDFTTFVISLSTSAFAHMGLVEDPVTRKKSKNLDLARQDIDLIEMMAEKTKGNLSPQEAEMMEQVLYELRLRFVEASR